MKRDKFKSIEPEVSAYQVAEHFNVNEGTVRRWMHLGMPANKYNARFIRYKISEVEKWLQARGAQLDEARCKKVAAHSAD
jgi:hypothetical protein